MPPARLAFAKLHNKKAATVSPTAAAIIPPVSQTGERSHLMTSRTHRKVLAASILIVTGIIIGMVLNGIYAADIPGQLPRFVTPAYLKLLSLLALYVFCATGIYFCERPRGWRRVRVLELN